MSEIVISITVISMSLVAIVAITGLTICHLVKTRTTTDRKIDS